MLQKGKYKHFKGSTYEVLGVGIHTETKEQMVVYKEENTQQLWIRPLHNFLEEVEKDGKKVKRFVLLSIEPQ